VGLYNTPVIAHNISHMAEYGKYQKSGRDQNRGWRSEYKKFRVKSSIKSFRDLEVYKQTTLLSAEICQFQLPRTIKNRKSLEDDFKKLKELTKHIPRLIAESYGDKFTNLDLSSQKLEKSMQIISMVIAKTDFLIASVDSQEISETLNTSLKKYQIQRVKILNLKKAWQRVFKR